jgi:hypothetical protein
MTNRKPELYDITHDPREHQNLYGTIDATQVQKELKDRLEWYKERYHVNGA